MPVLPRLRSCPNELEPSVVVFVGKPSLGQWWSDKFDLLFGFEFIEIGALMSVRIRPIAEVASQKFVAAKATVAIA